LTGKKTLGHSLSTKWHRCHSWASAASLSIATPTPKTAPLASSAQHREPTTPRGSLCLRGDPNWHIAQSAFIALFDPTALCADAKDRQILLSQRVNVALKGSVATEQVGALALKGLTQPVIAYNVPPAATQPALRVIEGGPQSV
jgi:hypothetical protein